MNCHNPHIPCSGTMRHYHWLDANKVECDRCGYRMETREEEVVNDAAKIAKAIADKGIDLTQEFKENE